MCALLTLRKAFDSINRDLLWLGTSMESKVNFSLSFKAGSELCQELLLKVE